MPGKYPFQDVKTSLIQGDTEKNQNSKNERRKSSRKQFSFFAVFQVTTYTVIMDNTQGDNNQ